MKIAVVWWFDKASWVWPNWRDGYRAAWDEIGKEHTVRWFLDKERPAPDEDWDFICLWDDSNSGFFQYFDEYKCKKGISLTTDPYNFENLKKADVVFVESDPIYNTVRANGLRAVKAFGTDTDYFSPENVEKDIPYFYPATFSPWKRQSDLAYLGEKLYLVGTVQPDGQQELETCQKAGCHIEIGYFPVEKIKKYYDRTQQILIPAVHGSERTVLEAMSMNIPVTVTHPEINKRAASYLEQFKASDEPTSRDFVLKNYSHKVMAKNLLRGMV